MDVHFRNTIDYIRNHFVQADLRYEDAKK